ncbi:BsuPI-related putative proteinase inhibitor [Shewanella sp. NIFS-20-20]|uniref:BsuPI-related putative proteinase inhibitor n=1 Tax=Shewanella sp. NIFS-20-20 TaxID=2853806 RepID=UPI001C43724A|nr:BsuPI-related putative proteinase inhibitor [Shewanella sp. NIFS-20-20]MBV7315066.1 hypothetical protein [Shewanella sp. NIFS-20-20]
MKYWLSILLASSMGACAEPPMSSVDDATAIVGSQLHPANRMKSEATMTQGVLTGSLSQREQFVTLTVENPTDKAVYLVFNSGQNGDLTLMTDKGQTLWRWSSGFMFTQAIRETTLAAGASLEVKFTVPAEVMAQLKPGMQWQASYSGRMAGSGQAAMTLVRQAIN